MLQTSIWVTFSFERTHYWPGVVEKKGLENVGYLRYPHRHIFHGRVDIVVDSDEDRAVEFITFKKQVQKFIDNAIIDPSTASCEAMAKIIITYLTHDCNIKEGSVEISEDKENGVRIKFADQ